MSICDRFDRPLRNLRLSVTDRCNLRCSYCMPEENYTWLPRGDILDFEEISSLVDRFLELGVTRLRLTGGEPLLRKNLHRLVAMLAPKPGLEDLALTTNAVLLEEQAQELQAAGLGRVTVSLDTLRQDRFEKLTRRPDLDRVLRGIDALGPAGFEGTKLDTVVIRNVNDDELIDLIEYGKRVQAEVRFIEYMDVGGATDWSFERVVSRREMLDTIAEHYGELRSIESGSAPADRYLLPDGTVIGVISSTTEPFCGSCDRSRLTADGRWYQCLYGREGVNLCKPLRAGASNEELQAILRSTWTNRDARGAEDRLRQAARGAYLMPEDLRADPHMEMHTRGG